MKRKIVVIDEEKCDGCGDCVPSCAEGALQVVDGKVKLVAEAYCDGLGACLGDCPQGAITVEERDVDPFDEAAVAAHLAGHRPAPPPPAPEVHAGCPGSRARRLDVEQPEPSAAPAAPAGRSRLGQWPVQIHLLPVVGELWQDADVLVAADCVPFAMAGFHEALLAGRTVAIGCPKLDDLRAYAEKLTEIFRRNPIRSVTVATMEVPCCHGLLMATRQALAVAGRADVPFHDVLVGVRGDLLSATPPACVAPPGRG